MKSVRTFVLCVSASGKRVYTNREPLPAFHGTDDAVTASRGDRDTTPAQPPLSADPFIVIDEPRKSRRANLRPPRPAVPSTSATSSSGHPGFSPLPSTSRGGKPSGTGVAGGMGTPLTAVSPRPGSSSARTRTPVTIEQHAKSPVMAPSSSPLSSTPTKHSHRDSKGRRDRDRDRDRDQDRDTTSPRLHRSSSRSARGEDRERDRPRSSRKGDSDVASPLGRCDTATPTHVDDDRHGSERRKHHKSKKGKKHRDGDRDKARTRDDDYYGSAGGGGNFTADVSGWTPVASMQQQQLQLQQHLRRQASMWDGVGAIRYATSSYGGAVLPQQLRATPGAEAQAGDDTGATAAVAAGDEGGSADAGGGMRLNGVVSSSVAGLDVDDGSSDGYVLAAPKRGKRRRHRDRDTVIELSMVADDGNAPAGVAVVNTDADDEQVAEAVTGGDGSAYAWSGGDGARQGSAANDLGNDDDDSAVRSKRHSRSRSASGRSRQHVDAGNDGSAL